MEQDLLTLLDRVRLEAAPGRGQGLRPRTVVVGDGHGRKAGGSWLLGAELDGQSSECLLTLDVGHTSDLPEPEEPEDSPAARS